MIPLQSVKRLTIYAIIVIKLFNLKSSGTIIVIVIRRSAYDDTLANDAVFHQTGRGTREVLWLSWN
jgi:hypothetical protein